MLDSQKQLELDTLIHKLVDGEIGPFEFQRLNDMLLHDKDAQRHYLQHADMVNTIRWQLIGEATQQSIAALKTIRATAPKPAADAIPERPVRPRFTFRLPSVDVRYAAAAAIVLGVTLIGMLIASRLQTAPRMATAKDSVTIPIPPFPPESPELEVAIVPRVEQRAGDVQVHEPGNAARSVEVAIDIQPGQTVETRGQESTTILAYKDKTNIVVGNDTTFTVEKASHKRLALNSGSLAADVSPQPASKPMVIITPHAEIQVVGTRFSVETEADQTKLSVTQGKVRIRLVQQEDGRWTEVPAGQYAIAQPAKNMVFVDAIPLLPKTWTEDFEQGLPVGWKRGVLVNDGCCKQGWKSVQTERLAEGLYQIRSQIKRSEGEGLFQIHPDTHLHLLIKVKQHGAVNLYLATRSAGPLQDYGNYIYKNFDQHLHKNRWNEVTIPIQYFQRANGFLGEHPEADDIPIEIMLGTSKADLGLTLDKIWVTQGGDGEVKAVQHK